MSTNLSPGNQYQYLFISAKTCGLASLDRLTVYPI